MTTSQNTVAKSGLSFNKYTSLMRKVHQPKTGFRMQPLKMMATTVSLPGFGVGFMDGIFNRADRISYGPVKMEDIDQIVDLTILGFYGDAPAA